jgi:hypothetical protein
MSFTEVRMIAISGSKTATIDSTAGMSLISLQNDDETVDSAVSLPSI